MLNHHQNQLNLLNQHIKKKDIDKWVVKKTYPLETVVHEDIIPVYVPKSTYVPKESTYIPREYVPKEST